MSKPNEKLAPWEVLSNSIDYQTPWFKVHKQKLKTASGVEATYYIHESVDSVMVVTRNDRGSFLIEKQYRPPVEKVEYDYPAGKIEPADKSPEVAARRELSEETGFKTNDIELLATLDMNPGFSKDRLYIFLASVSGRGETELDSTESIVTQFLAPSKIQELISNGKMSCTFCIAATYLAFTHLGLLNPRN